MYVYHDRLTRSHRIQFQELYQDYENPFFFIDFFDTCFYTPDLARHRHLYILIALPRKLHLSK